MQFPEDVVDVAGVGVAEEIITGVVEGGGDGGIRLRAGSASGKYMVELGGPAHMQRVINREIRGRVCRVRPKRPLGKGILVGVLLFPGNNTIGIKVVGFDVLNGGGPRRVARDSLRVAGSRNWICSASEPLQGNMVNRPGPESH